MEKSRFTFRVDSNLLKEMKIFAIERNMNLNELLIECYKCHSSRYHNILDGNIIPFDKICDDSYDCDF